MFSLAACFVQQTSALNEDAIPDFIQLSVKPTFRLQRITMFTTYNSSLDNSSNGCNVTIQHSYRNPVL